MAGRTVKLTEPIKIDGEEVTEVKIRKLRAKHLRKLDLTSPDIDQSLDLIAELTGIPESSLDEMLAEDFIVCANVVGESLKKFQKTG